MSHTPLLHRKVTLVVALLLAMLAPAGTAAPPPKGVTWMINFNATLIKAKKENKYILAYFSGSDWDEWGKKLDKEVINTQLFADWANKTVVTFRADFAANKKQDLYKKQNEDLKTKYQVAEVPTFLLLDGDGEVVARAKYDNLKLQLNEPPGQPRTAIEFLDNMVKNKGEVEKLVEYESLAATLANAKAHKLPVLLLVTKGTDKDPMIPEAEKLVQNQRFVRWANINTSFRAMKWPEATDKSEDAAIFKGLVTRFKFGNTPAQLLMFNPEEETLRLRMASWTVMAMEPLMMRLQKELPKIDYKGTDWLTDLRLAKAIVAQQPERLLFLYFADGTEFCEKFEKEILEKEEFTSWPFYHMVLVRFDFTKGVQRPVLLDQQNNEQANLYAVRGYPFVVLVNYKGQKVGEAKYQKGGPVPFINELKRIYQQDMDRRIKTVEVEAPAAKE